MIRFQVDHTLFLNIAFGIAAGILIWLHLRGRGGGGQQPAHAEGKAQAGHA